MKTYLWLICFVLTAACFFSCNNNKSNKSHLTNTDTTKANLNYKFDVPPGWTTEHIPFPIDFAQTINYTGIEDLRFTKGWGDATSEEHWTYAFLWWLDGKPTIDANTLQENFTTYYTGLVRRNIQQRSIPQIKLVPTFATIKKVETDESNALTFNGTISMLDYITQTPMVLNCIVHVKDCNAQKHTAVITEISPKPYTHSIWQKLNALNKGFKCEDK